MVPLPKQGAIRESMVKPTELSLEQNYPNPFNPATAIRYRVPEQNHVVLRVFDTHGRVVATLVDETQQPGMYSVVLDADDLPSGLYMYRLESGGISLQKEMILLK